jgi:hypothetical protein
MALPPSDHDHSISLDQAKKLMGGHRERTKGTGLRSGGFRREAIDKLLAQPGCVAVRFYMGKYDDGTESLVLVGVDENGMDMTEGLLINNQWPCPPFCPPESALSI